MLRELRIKNFAIIDSLSIEFKQGLNILTGETGAGKSIIVDALGLLLGSRAQNEQIRTGSDEAEIQGFFDVEGNDLPKQLDIDDSQGIIIRRIVSRSGKSRAYLNDTLVNIRTLEELGRTIVDIHGQHDHQSLLSTESQLGFLDSFGKLEERVKEYGELYRESGEIRQELDNLKNESMERARRLDLLRFQVEEIREADVRVGELSRLEEERRILFNSTRLRELCEAAYELIRGNENSALDSLNTAMTNLQMIAEFDQGAAEALELLRSALPLMTDASASLRDMKEKYNADPVRLEQVEKRLDTLKGLRRKYGDSEEQILEYLESASADLNALETSDERIEALAGELESIEQKVREAAEFITKKRKDAAGKAQALVTEKLGELAFRKAVFAVDVSETKDGNGGRIYGAKGFDRVEFLFSANPPEGLKPLKKIASGGELSRIMLAIKSVFADIDEIPIMVFDEVDAGIGGKTAGSVGTMLRELSSRHQVLCVTHLAQIASQADIHFSIEKHQGAKRTGIEVKLLNNEERIREIARMLSGEITPTSLKHSEELLKVRRKAS